VKILGEKKRIAAYTILYRFAVDAGLPQAIIWIEIVPVPNLTQHSTQRDWMSKKHPVIL